MDPLDELEGRIDSLIKQLTEKKSEIAGLRKQKSDSKLSDSKKKELTVKFEQDVNKAEKEFNDLMKGIEEQFPVESDSESDSDSSSDAAPSSPRPNAVIDLDEEGDEDVNDDFLEGLAVNKDQMEQELDKVLKMMKEIEVSPPGSIENMTSTVDSFASQKDKDDFGKAPGDRRARMFRNREMSFNSAFMELSDVAKYEEEEANGLLASEGTGLTISDFTSNMSTSISSVTDSDEPGSESRYSINSSQSPPPTREEVHKRLRSKAETFSQLINLVQLKEALAKGTLNFDDGEDEDSLADLKIKAKDIIISNPIAQETIRKLSLSRGRTVSQSRSSENFQALKVAGTPKAPQLILNIVINDANGKTIAKNKIKISSEAKVIKVKEKILMKIDVNALTSSSGSMGVFLAEYGIFLNNKRTLRSYDLKDEDKLILRKKPTQGLDYVSVHFPASPEIKLRNQQIKCQPDVTTLMGLIKAVDKYYNDASPLPYEKYGLYSLKDMKWLPVNIKKPLSYWKLKNQDILEFREMTSQIINEVKKEEQRILESEQMSVSVLVEITKFLERTSVQMQFDETIQEVLKRVVDDIRRKNPEVSSDYTQYGFFTLTSNELLEEFKTVRASMELLKIAVVLKQKSKEDIKRDKKKKLIALKEERKRQKDGKKEKRKSSDIKKKKRRSVKSMKPEKTTTDKADVPKRNNMSQSALSVAVKSVRAIHAENNN